MTRAVGCWALLGVLGACQTKLERSTSAVVLAKNCANGARRQGPNAEHVIAWLYALDEQAQSVDEPSWPP